MTKTEYKKRIWQYKNRRQKSYETSRRLSAKIRQMEACLAGMEVRENKANKKIDLLLRCVNDFFALDITNQISNAEYKLARNVYYKIGLEMQIREVLLCKKINRNKKAASYGRLTLTKSFDVNSENKKTYHNFKEYFKSFTKNELSEVQ